MGRCEYFEAMSTQKNAMETIAFFCTICCLFTLLHSIQQRSSLPKYLSLL